MLKDLEDGWHAMLKDLEDGWHAIFILMDVSIFTIFFYFSFRFCLEKFMLLFFHLLSPSRLRAWYVLRATR